MTKNILIFIHGITPNSNPPDPENAQYRRLLDAVAAKDPSILKKFDDEPIFVKWGALYGSPPPGKGHQRLDRAEEFASDRASDDNAKKMPGNVWNRQLRLPIIAGIIDDIKYSVISKGLADALYYAAPDGEELVRAEVYSQLAREIAPLLKGKDEVRLHFVTHSLGVSIGHDFAYAVFNPGQKSSFVKDHATGSVRANFKTLQKRAKEGTLKFGSFVGMASQLPLFIMRSQKVVELFAAGKYLDPVDIGVTSKKEVVVKFFYDPDDLLGFPSRGLYSPNDAFCDVRVQTGQNPATAHTDYWWNSDVADQVIELWKRRT